MGCGCKAPAVPVYRWAGVRWYGLPMPLRVAGWLVYLYRGWTREGLPTFAARFPGCGCVKVWKDWWGVKSGRKTPAH